MGGAIAAGNAKFDSTVNVLTINVDGTVGASNADFDGNVVQGDVTILDSHNSLVVSEGRYTAVIGVEDLIVVTMEDATIVLPRSQSERVQDIVHWLKSRQRDELL